MSHIHASAQHLAGRMRAFTGDPRAFLIRLSERQAGTLARRKLLPSKKGSLPCSWKQTFHILLRKCFGFGRQKSLFLTKCAKSLLSRFVWWSRPCCRSFLCVFRCLTSIISILPDPRAYEPLVSLISSQQATQDLNWAGITAPSAWQRRLCGRFQEKSLNNLSGDASALIFFAVVLFCELLTGKNILHPCRLESFTDVIGFTECKKIKVFFQHKHFTSGCIYKFRFTQCLHKSKPGNVEHGCKSPYSRTVFTSGTRPELFSLFGRWELFSLTSISAGYNVGLVLRQNPGACRL